MDTILVLTHISHDWALYSCIESWPAIGDKIPNT